MNDPNTAPVFEAESYPVSQGVSSYPTMLPVVGSQPFAIHNYGITAKSLRSNNKKQ